MIFTGNLERIANETLSDIQQRHWITEFVIELGSVNDENQVLSQALEVVRNRFQYIFAQFYLLDSEGHFNRTMRYGSTQPDAVTRENFSLSDANVIFDVVKQKKALLTSSDD